MNKTPEFLQTLRKSLGQLNSYVVSARGAREDIVTASVDAMINGINKILLKRKIEKHPTNW